MSKRLIILVLTLIILSVCVWIIFMKRSADIARERSDNILEEFKKSDAGLQKTNDSIHKANDELYRSLKKKLTP